MAKQITKTLNGVYVGSTLAYASRLKTDATKAASKLKAAGKRSIRLKAVKPNPITGKLPKVGWREQFKAASRAQPKKRRNPPTSILLRRNVDGYLDAGGQFRPIRGSEGYDPRYAGDLSKSYRSLKKKPKKAAKKAKKRRNAASILLRRNVDGYLDASGQFRPIRGSKGYDPRYAGDYSESYSAIKKRGGRKKASKKAKKRNPSGNSVRDRYMVQVGETPAWVGKLKSDANKAWRKLNAAGLKDLKIFKVQITKAVKDGWRKAFKPGSSKNPRTSGKRYKVWMPRPRYFATMQEAIDIANEYARRTGIFVSVTDEGSKRNPSFPGRKGSGQRFQACVRAMSKRSGVNDPKGLCAAIGRRKYGAKGMARLAAKGRRKNPGYSYFAKADNEKAIYSLGGVKIERAISEASALARRKGADVTLYRGKWKEDGSVGKKVRVRRIKLG